MQLSFCEATKQLSLAATPTVALPQVRKGLPTFTAVINSFSAIWIERYPLPRTWQGGMSPLYRRVPRWPEAKQQLRPFDMPLVKTAES